MAMSPWDAFKPAQLLRYLEKFPSNAANTVMQSKFGRDEAPNDLYEWDEITYDRTLAPMTGADAASTRVGKLSKVHRVHSVAHMKLNTFIDGRRIFFQERAAGELRPNATLVVAREMRNLRMRMERTIEYMCAQALTGTLTVNSSTVPGTDTSFTVTYTGVGSFSKSAAWSTAGTKIFSTDLTTEKINYMRQSGFELRNMWFNNTVGQDLLANTEAQNWLQTTQRGVQVFESGWLGQMANLSFTQYDGYYDSDGAGTMLPYIADDNVVFTTDDSTFSQYCVLVEGRGLIPREAIGADQSMLATPAPSNGFYAYTTVETDPVGLKLVVGWVGLPVLQFPEIITYGATV